MWVVISEGDKKLKELEDYSGQLPKVDEEIKFLSGEGSFIVTHVGWQTSNYKHAIDFLCNIQVKNTLNNDNKI